MGESGEWIAETAAREPAAPAEDLWVLVCSHLDLVRRIARSFHGSRIAAEDLRAEGVLGLVEAAVRFDPAYGVRFASYASWWVRKAMREAALRETSVVSVSKYRYDQLARIRAAHRDLRHELGRSPRLHEVADRAGLDEDVAAEAIASSPRVLSLEDPASSGAEISVGETIAEGREPEPETAALHAGALGLLRRGLAALPRRERDVLRHHFGLEGVEPKTLGAIAASYGLSRERIHQIERAAIRRLRRSLHPTRREAEA